MEIAVVTLLKNLWKFIPMPMIIPTGIMTIITPMTMNITITMITMGTIAMPLILINPFLRKMIV
ncbi:hypothetical protein [Picosynechococcus sp. PCC 73109]|uniref:hypothetical protein n=1 Tax=Picosynechococcus sp. PCC 73109 TaxID=374982 RepID=UPI0030DA7937